MADEKSELSTQLARAREALGENWRRTKRDLDVPAKVSRSFRENKIAWGVGAVLLGLAISKLPARTKKIYVETGKRGEARKIAGIAEAGVAAVLLKFALTAARPFLTSFISKKASEWMEKRR